MSSAYSVSQSVLVAIFPGGPGLVGTRMSILHFVEAKDDGGGGNDWSYKQTYFPFSALTLFVGRQEGHPACKKQDVGLLMVMLCTTYSSSCHHQLHQPLLQQTPANPGSPGKWPLKKRRERYIANVYVKIQY